MQWKRALRSAIRYVIDNGVSDYSLSYANSLLRKAISSVEPSIDIRGYLHNIYKSQVRNSIKVDRKFSNKFIPVFTSAQLSEQQKLLLNKKIQESLNLIKFNREQAVTATLQRFQGWASSLNPKLPKSIESTKRVRTGYKMRPKSIKEIEVEAKRRKIPKSNVSTYKKVPIYELKKVRKPLPLRILGNTPDSTKVLNALSSPITSLKYKERRVAIDQGHKLAANINEVIAYSNNAIGFTWRHHFSKSPRPDHEALDGETFLYKNSWAMKESLVYSSRNLIEKLDSVPAQEVNCRCTADYIYDLSELQERDPSLLTEKGKKYLKSQATI